MNGTPRALNRFLLSLVGLLLLLAGIGLTVLAAVPAAARRWQDFSGAQVAWLRSYENRSRLLVTSESWIWLAAAAFFLLVVVLMISWIANQGKGRASTLVDYQGNADDDGADRKETGLKVRVFPRQGIAPQNVAEDVVELVEALDGLLGIEVPVLLSIGTGARSRFTKAERVR